MDASTHMTIAAVALAMAASWSLVGLAILYARRRGMMDQPGRRRSHTMPTPRGGGIGIVAVVLVGGLVALWGQSGLSPPLVGVWAAALAIVAAVGWLDDHASLRIWPRLLAQLLASGGFAAALLIVSGWSWWWWPLATLAGVASINLHNFMDGIDGLLAMQATFVLAVAAVLAGLGHQHGVALAAWIGVGACIGFWLHNRSPARIFMGDVGSGALGLLVFMFGALVSVGEWRAVWPMLAACSGFVIDAGLTLSWRMLKGRRWYTPHREHLYQWLVRCGWTHARTGSLYMSWNLLTLPFAWVAWHWPSAAPVSVVILYALGAWGWRRGRRFCLDSFAGRARHGLA